MGCYCGCRTYASKVRWACLAAALIAGFTVYGIFGLLMVKDVNDYEGCMNKYLAEGKMTQAEYDEYNFINQDPKTRTYAIGHTPNQYVNICENNYMERFMMISPLSLLIFIFFTLATVPACMMCCCASKPEPTYTPLEYSALPSDEPLVANSRVASNKGANSSQVTTV